MSSARVGVCVPKRQCTRAELIEILREQFALLESTAETYDAGLEVAANLLAVTVREVR